MAEQEQVSVSHEAALDHPHKRKLEDLEAPPSEVAPPDSTTDVDGDVTHVGDNDNDDENGADEASDNAKRPRLDDKPDGLASANGIKPEEDDENAADTAEAVENAETAIDDQAGGDEQQANEAAPEEVNEVQPGSESEPKVDTQSDNAEEGKDVQVPLSENEQVEDANKSTGDELQEPAADLVEQKDGAPGEHLSENGTRTRRIEIPNNKVGVLIGKAGDTIKYLQINSGAKIQITRDADSDPRASTRPVELVGSLESLNKAEKLIKDVIAEADAGGSPSLVARGFNASATTGSVEIEMHVPSDKVGLIIGKGGETIRSLQTRSGARIQLIPQSFPGDQSKEKKVKVTGDKKQVETARDLIKEVMNQPSGRQAQFSSNNYNQQAYRPRGPGGHGGAPQWGPRGPPQPMPYDYHQRGPYPSQNQQYPGQSYGNYPPQGPPRGSYGSGWEHRPPAHGAPSHTGGYDYYGQGGGHAANAPGSAPQPAHMPGHASGQSMGPPHSQPNYNYGQPRVADYPQPAPYSQMAPPAQNYAPGYGEPKYDGQGQMQQPYGGPGYGHQQPYSRPAAPHGMPSQGAPPQGYAPPTASQPVDTAYQAPASAPQQYAQNVQAPQQYPYASGAMTQAPYGSAPVGNDGYGQPQPAAAGYPQQGGQQVAAYGQQPASGYPQAAAPISGYGQYPSAAQPGYSDPSATAAAASAATYGYQGQVDPSAAYAAAGQAYNAVPQQGYAQPQPVPAQPGYDQSAAAAQSGGYASAPAGAPAAVAYGKTVSPQPQPGYPQYDASQQMYAAPR